MTMRHGSADLHAWWQSRGNALVLVILLFVVLAATFALAARTPWILDQPMPPYNWAITP
jgi:succinate dehydrogenase hydrophobic anchor subunit